MVVEQVPVTVTAGRVELEGDLSVPADASGIVVFAHGSGSGRMSPRNRAVAQALVSDGLATLLFDLLTRDEEIEERYTRHLRFDIPLLADRLAGTLAWVHEQERSSAAERRLRTTRRCGGPRRVDPRAGGARLRPPCTPTRR
jgi:hypothetical protein